MLVDANILVYAVNTAAPEHQRATAWLEATLNGDRRVGLPWESLTAFVRLVTHPRSFPRPLAPSDAWDIVEAWLAAPVAWVPGRQPSATRPSWAISSARYRLSGNLVPDAHLAAIAIEQEPRSSLPTPTSPDSRSCRWFNPLAGT